MKVLVISDIHENFDNLAVIFQEVSDKDIDFVICLGDLINNGIAKMIVSHGYKTHLIWWNNDGEVVNVTKSFLSTWNTVAATVFDDIELWGRKIFLTHYSNIAKSMAKSGDYDAVFYWHNHKLHQETINNCYVLNPGEVWAHKTWIASYAIYDTDANAAEIFMLENPSSVKSTETSQYMKQITQFELSTSKTHLF
jgi:putative phosphoesterase